MNQTFKAGFSDWEDEDFIEIEADEAEEAAEEFSRQHHEPSTDDEEIEVSVIDSAGTRSEVEVTVDYEPYYHAVIL